MTSSSPPKTVRVIWTVCCTDGVDEGHVLRTMDRAAMLAEKEEALALAKGIRADFERLGTGLRPDSREAIAPSLDRLPLLAGIRSSAGEGRGDRVSCLEHDPNPGLSRRHRTYAKVIE